jgi:hypothetical protein
MTPMLVPALAGLIFRLAVPTPPTGLVAVFIATVVCGAIASVPLLVRFVPLIGNKATPSGA